LTAVRRAETLQHRAKRARELRNGIVAAAAALAVIDTGRVGPAALPGLGAADGPGGLADQAGGE